MEAHVHPDTTLHWGSGAMRAHLQASHGITVPMAWTPGQMHQAHLESHQQDTATPKAKEAPMTQTPHEHTAAEHRGDGPELAQHLGKVHGYHSSNDLENFVVTHRQLHAEAAGEDQQVEEAARALWVQETGRPEGSWNDTSRDMRAHFRRKIRQRQIGYGAASREHGERHAEYRIMVDRVTAVMAGLDFDRDWAADDGIGPNARGALRVTFQRAAEQTLAWLERGGLEAIPGYLDLLNERVCEERDHAQQIGAAAAQEAAQLRQQMGEQQRAMQEMAQDRELAESLNRDLEETNNQLREQLETTGRQLQMALAEKDRLFEVAGDMERERNEARIAFNRMDTQRVATEQELREQLAEATDERDRAQQALMAKLAEAAELRDLAERRAQLLVELSGPVSTVTEASQAPIESVQVEGPLESGTKVTVTIGGQEIDAGGEIVSVSWPSVEEDDLSWARRFAAGEL